MISKRLAETIFAALEAGDDAIPMNLAA